MSRTKKKQPDKATAVSADQAVIAGVDKYFASAQPVRLGGTAFTPAGLKAVFQAEIDALRELTELRAALAQKVADTAVIRDYAFSMRAALRTYILTVYGPDALQMVGDFGMTVPKKRALEAAETEGGSAAKPAG